VSLLRLLRVLGFLVFFLLLFSVAATANGSSVDLFRLSTLPDICASNSRQHAGIARVQIAPSAAPVNHASAIRTTAERPRLLGRGNRVRGTQVLQPYELLRGEFQICD
jgi:hypothetical protein